ncbi:ABC transporter ATP-binding protein [soil metagenome]
MSEPPLLKVSDLSVSYGLGVGAFPALRSAYVEARAGEVVGIVGESGSGKSTLAMAIAGLLPPAATITGGRIVLEGIDLTHEDTKKRRAHLGQEIAMVFQDPMTAFNPVLTIGDQLCDFQHRMGVSRRERQSRAVGMLGRVGIPDPALRYRLYPHELSGGMRQRAAIAAALLVNPGLLIADEPTTALDVTMEAQIIQLFRDLRRDYGGAILIVTHHLGVVAELCDRVYVMYGGEVMEDGDVDQIFHAPVHPYTQALLRCDPALLPERVARLPVIERHERSRFVRGAVL